MFYHWSFMWKSLLDLIVNDYIIDICECGKTSLCVENVMIPHSLSEKKFSGELGDVGDNGRWLR